MSTIKIISPTDPPQGKNRLLTELLVNLKDEKFDSFIFVVAFAKVGPLLKLYNEIIEWKREKTINAIFGIDHKGTSSEVLQFAIDHFNNAFIIHVLGKPNPTFHPKMYLFKGTNDAIAYVGSNNLTVGGTETNFESYVRIKMKLPEDNGALKQIEDSWNNCKESSVKLDHEYLEKLISNDLVIAESAMRIQEKKLKRNTTEGEGAGDKIDFPYIKIVPPAPIPQNVLEKGFVKIVIKGNAQEGKRAAKIREDVPVSGLLMNIIPHHNGEILLSMNAVNQNKSFFEWPFTGETVPKKDSNPSYPQRVPDPIVDIILYDEKGASIYSISNFGLNTVYYETKSELRITVPIDIYNNSIKYLEGPYPILLMKREELEEGKDYQIEIYLPGSDQYNLYGLVCNQSMPSGGKSIARRFGWL